MRTWVCSVLLLFAGCNEVTGLTRVCPYRCYEGPEKTRNVGSCREGFSVCDENFNIIACNEQVLPTEEICDNQDNNCNGLADDVWLYARYTYPTNGVDAFPCPTMGECWNSTGVCVDGHWECTFEDTVELGGETRCDKKDNDCDGMIDEDVFDSLSISERICYSGNPAESLAYPPCRAGLLECIRGEVICLNEVTPSVELCDRVDNDCNGFTDDTGDILSEQYDVVFVIDTSGSMCDEIAAVAGACNAYAQQFDGNPNFRFALVIMSKNLGWGAAENYVYLDTDFSDFSTIRNRLLNLGCNGGGYEASMDAMKHVCDKQSNFLSLSFRENANSLFFMFTDETQQSYLTPPVTGQNIIDACLGSSTLPFIWSRTPIDFEYIALGANGYHFTLVNDWQTIFSNMNSVVITLCGSGGP